MPTMADFDLSRVVVDQVREAADRALAVVERDHYARAHSERAQHARRLRDLLRPHADGVGSAHGSGTQTKRARSFPARSASTASIR